MGDDESALLRLWQEKRGEIEPEDPGLQARMISTHQISSRQRHWPTGNKKDRLNSGQERSTQQSSGRRPAKAIPIPPEPILQPEASAALRDQLTAELSEITSTEEAADWAHRVLGAKNSLIAADAERIHEAFRGKLATFATATANGLETPPEKERPRTQRPSHRVIDKSVLALPELRRIRDREHVRYVTHQSCLICGRRPSDAHHLRFAQNRALSRKVSDEFTVPLCRGHHREVHRSGNEAAWWKKAGIDPSITARALSLETHPLPANTHRWPEKGPLPPR
jgi:hypothetical protein